MKAATNQLHPPASNRLHLAQVITTDQGRPTHVAINQSPFKVALVSHHLPFIFPGDTLLALIDKLNTVQAHSPKCFPIQDKEEKCVLPLGKASIELNAQGEISLKTPGATLVLTQSNCTIRSTKVAIE